MGGPGHTHQQLVSNEENKAVARFQTLRLGAKLPKLYHMDIRKSSRHFNKNMESMRLKLIIKTASLTHGGISTESAFIRKTNRFWS